MCMHAHARTPPAHLCMCVMRTCTHACSRLHCTYLRLHTCALAQTAQKNILMQACTHARTHRLSSLDPAVQAGMHGTGLASILILPRAPSFLFSPLCLSRSSMDKLSFGPAPSCCSSFRSVSTFSDFMLSSTPSKSVDMKKCRHEEVLAQVTSGGYPHRKSVDMKKCWHEKVVA